jgi:hypothetical protein
MKRIHKRCLLFTFMLLVTVTHSFSQTLKEFFNNSTTQLTYLGIDFTKNLIIKDADANSADVVGRLYGSINNLVIKEQGNSVNYDISGAFKRKNAVYIDTGAVTANNKKIDAANIMSSHKSDFKRLKEADIANCVEALPLESREGTGLVFIMEGMKKIMGKGYGAVWVTLIDMKTKQVLMTVRIEHEAEGIGFRNYWVSVIRKTIVDIDWSRYSYWKKKYAH